MVSKKNLKFLSPIANINRPFVKRRDALAKVMILMGGSLSAPALSGMLSGCQFTRPAAEGAAPDLLFLTPDQDRLVTEIAELIIPTTDTPGAREANVNEFIDVMLAECYTPEDQQSFVMGLEQLEQQSQAEFGKPFVEASVAQKTSLLKQTAAEAQEKRQPGEPVPFFRTIKELTLLGYFSSEIGATQTLAYLPVPGRYEGCLPLEETQKSWAL
jgi:hypothetical protein